MDLPSLPALPIPNVPQRNTIMSIPLSPSIMHDSTPQIQPIFTNKQLPPINNTPFPINNNQIPQLGMFDFFSADNNDDMNYYVPMVTNTQSSQFISSEQVLEVDPDTIIRAPFNDAIKIKELMNIVTKMKKIDMYFSRDTIRFISVTKDEDFIQVMIETFIDCNKLIGYEYFSNVDTTFVQFSTNILKTHLASISVKKSLIISNNSENDNYLFDIGEGGNLHEIPPIKGAGIINYDTPEYNRHVNNPNAKCTCVRFKEICSVSSKGSHDYVSFIAFEDRIEILRGAITGEKVQGSGMMEIGADREDQEPICIYKVKTSHIKGLTKIHNLAPNGIVSFYIEEDKPIKIVASLGLVGVIKVYIVGEKINIS